MSDEQKTEQDPTATPPAAEDAAREAIRKDDGPNIESLAAPIEDATKRTDDTSTDDVEDDAAQVVAAPAPPAAPKPTERRIIVVSRADKLDTAEWLPLSDPRAIAQYHRSNSAPVRPEGSSIPPMLFGIVGSLVIIVATVLLLRGQGERGPTQPLIATVADVQAVHSSVTTSGTAVHKTRRLSVGDVVTTDNDGRARLRLDDGTSLVVDRETNLKLTAKM